MFEKKLLLVVLGVVDDADASDKINNIIRVVIEQIRSTLMTSVAVNPFQSEL